jgi:hypothetical protein
MGKDEVEFKECRNCRVERHRSFFAKKTLSCDGLQYWCRLCLRIRNNKVYKKNDFLKIQTNSFDKNKLDLLIESVIIYHKYYKD